MIAKSLQPGARDRLITIQRKNVSTSESGEAVPAWQTIAARWWANVRPVRGSERFINPQINAYEQVEFWIRYSSTVADLSPQDRIVYPALVDQELEPDERQVYDILAVHEIGRREGLRIVTSRRPDAPP